MFLFRREPVAPELVEVFQIAGASKQVTEYIVQEKIQRAAQAYHDENGVPLREAIKAVTEIIVNAGRPDNLLAAGFPQDVVEKIEQRDKIGAIKAYRDGKNVSLRQAKVTIEHFLR
jgi:ribosomal protein L7/L12